MFQRQTVSVTSPKNSFSLRLQPAQAWMAILGLVLMTGLGTLAGAGSILRLVFPVGSFAVGLFLYLRYPFLYLGFTWWLWFITPLLRRLIDYRSGWDPSGLILISPYLVTLVTFVTFYKHLPKSYRQGGLPFALAAMGVFYGSLVGLVNNPPITVVRTLLDWITPVLFGFHLFVNWRDYPQICRNTQRTFLWGVLVTGVYGVVQYLVAPEWDRFWLIKSEIVSMGTPEPLGIRVWSTMHSPAPFACVILAGLLLLFTSKEPLVIPTAAAGYLSFLLSLVRSAWGGWLVGVLTMIGSLKAHLQMRFIITILVMAICVVPLTTIEPFSKIINSRFETFSNIENDHSFNDRKQNYSKNLSIALSEGFGSGLGSTWIVKDNGELEKVVLDSGILDTFFTLGWFGALPYLGGMILILFSLFQCSESRFDPFANVARSISFSIFVQLIFSSLMLGLSGLVLWGFLGMGMAAHKYYRYQFNIKPKIGGY